MTWKKKQRYNSKRSEEIIDIVERMPMAFGRWVAIAVVIFAALLFLFGWIIKYPDTVSGQIKINSDNVPVRLVANTSGNIRSLSFDARNEVKKGDYIAVIQNSAETQDVRKIMHLMDGFNPNDKNNIFDSKDLFPEKVSLGDLNVDYYTFLTAFKSSCEFEFDNAFEKQKIMLGDDITWKERLLKESEDVLETTQSRLGISKKWSDKYSTENNKDQMVISELEADKSKSEYLALLQEEQNQKKTISSLRMQIIESKNRINQLDVEQKEKRDRLYLDLLASYHKLNDNIKLWEQRYVFKAPFDGRVEYLRFLSENQFIQSSEEVFGIIPTENNVYGQMLLPSNGAGKVSIGNKVTVKLDNYPFMEYGSVEGVVSSMSLVSQTQKMEQGTVNVYFVTVELPEGLTTNYGEKLGFEYEIGGTADIIVKDRRLIERLFDNLKYRTK